ncbi:MAG: chromosome segregation protein SMC [Nocardioidaceae bacterium]|nr:chromosome segregation protein SMC [Nocardioidaceae bacterium]
MHLKTLTLRGFKSFASSTTLQLEPGITCVVGPNGSGKSNVVDALAWVMGEQGAKSLRGGKMEDVIFAGTSARPPLGRAEVLLTIDNTDGALPIDYCEVTISRTMFRGGGSEYAINGQICRLLDVQELLSDSGIGHEMHVIVGQGQLDAILHASPEDRRGFVEEAAGVLKHRKRKEKAMRKLDATDGNLTRLSDLLTEIRRQLKPLGRQAEVARRASQVQMETRDARARLLADDVVGVRGSLQRELADEVALKARRGAVESGLCDARQLEVELEEQLRADAPQLAAAQETWFALSGLRERIRGTASLAAERVRNFTDEPLEERHGQEPDELEVQAARVRADEDAINAEVEQLREGLGRAVDGRREAEDAYRAEEGRVAGLVRAAADRREGLAHLHGQVNTVKSRAAAAREEIGRLSESLAQAVARAHRAQRDFTSLEIRIAGLDAGERGLDSEHEGAASLLEDVDARLAKVREEAQTAERDRAALAARREALETGLARRDGAGALLAASDEVSGLMGSVAALLSVRHGDEAAVAAALGSAADAVAVQGRDEALAAIQHLKTADLGRAEMVLAGGEVDVISWPVLTAGAEYAVDVIDAPASLRPALHRLLFKTAVVADLAAAQALVKQAPDVVAVTRDGDLVSTHFAAGGSASQPSLIEVQAAVDVAAQDLADAAAACERLRFELTALENERADVQGRVDVTLAKLHESDAAMAAVAEELGQLGSLARNARAEADRIRDAIAAVEEARDRDAAGLAELVARLTTAQGAPDHEPDTSQRERLAEVTSSARAAETDSRLALRTAEERGRAVRGRADSLVRAAQQERTARQQAIVRRERRVGQARVAAAVGAGAQVLLAALERSLAESSRRRTQVAESRSEREQRLATTRAGLRELEVQLATLTDTVHRDEMVRAEHRMRMEQLEQRSLDELGLDLEALVADYGPDELVPALRIPDDEPIEPPVGAANVVAPQTQPEPVPFDREEQQKRLRSAERALAQLGRINPLALEEFSAMEERHKYLTEQLEDLKKTRRDLLDIVREVDLRVEQVFTQAYVDVAREFEQIFPRLFPAGEGRLVLTEPDDLLTSGIEVEARPAGKKVKRLSLLSGGERSLVAVAFLVALFKARPSPFYILDEVEAALDDTNLGRLLDIYEELGEVSQLLVITHQKRTMECADALYGVSMRDDGISALISQRMREAAPV